MLPSQDVKEGNVLIQWALLALIKIDPFSKMFCFEDTEDNGQLNNVYVYSHLCPLNWSYTVNISGFLDYDTV